MGRKEVSQVIYLIGSLRNPRIPQIANELRAAGYEVFDEWYSAGCDADEKWRDYERQRGHDLVEALKGYPARHVFEFDRRHLLRAHEVVLVLPAGKSGHLELGVALGLGKPGYVLLDANPDRYDVMYQFANGVCRTVQDLLGMLARS